MAKREEPKTGKPLSKDELPKAKLNWTNLKKSFRLFSYLGEHKWKFILGMVFLAASAGVGLVFPMKSGEMLGYIGDNNKPVDLVREELTSINRSGKTLSKGLYKCQWVFSQRTR
jgi:hypothetical protein